MQVLLVVAALVLLVALVMPDDFYRPGPPPPAAGSATYLRPPDADTGAPTVGLLSPEVVQRRLEALALELDRLEDDPGVIAKGFRTTVARTAYDALLADAAALRTVHRAPAASAQDRDLDFELL